MLKEIVQTAIWCIIASIAALMTLPGIAGWVGAIVCTDSDHYLYNH